MSSLAEFGVLSSCSSDSHAAQPITGFLTAAQEAHRFMASRGEEQREGVHYGPKCREEAGGGGTNGTWCKIEHE